MRWLIGLLIGLSAMLVLSGCERRIPKEELGKVIFEVPQVPGSEKPFIMPELEPLEKEKGEGRGE